MPQDLDVKVRDDVDALYKEAKAKLASGDKDGAVALATKAWCKVPEPKFDWDVSKSFAHTFVGILRDAGRFPEAIRLMEELFASGAVKPYQDQPRFVLGTIYAEMGDAAQAKKWFGEANHISKGRCFVGVNPKYRQYVD